MSEPTRYNQTQKLWKQKRRGSMSLGAYPLDQALALPLNEDKQRKACPRRDDIYTHHGIAHPIHLHTLTAYT